jgi:hypothetical protein
VKRALPVLAVVAMLAIGLVVARYHEDIRAFFVEPKPDVAAPLRYQGDLVTFDHPGNWSLRQEDGSESGIRLCSVTVESKGSAQVIVQIFEPAMDIDPDEAATSFLEGIQGQLSGGWTQLLKTGEGQILEVQGTVLGIAGPGKRIHLPLRIASERMPFTIEQWIRKTDRLTVIVTTMVADEDRVRVEPGFDLVKNSLAAVRP